MIYLYLKYSFPIKPIKLLIVVILIKSNDGICLPKYLSIIAIIDNTLKESYSSNSFKLVSKVIS